MRCEVIRQFPGDRGVHKPGEIVDTTGWLWTNNLIDQGYVRIVSFDEPAPSAPIAKRKETDAHARL